MPQTCRTQLCLDIEDFRPQSAHAGRNFRMPQTSFLLLAHGQQTGATQECAQASTGYCPAVPVVQKAQILCGTERMRGNARTALPGHPPVPPHCLLCPVWAPWARGRAEWGCSSGPPCAGKGQVPHLESWEGCWCQAEQHPPQQKGEKEGKM